MALGRGGQRVPDELDSFVKVRECFRQVGPPEQRRAEFVQVAGPILVIGRKDRQRVSR